MSEIVPPTDWLSQWYGALFRPRDTFTGALRIGPAAGAIALVALIVALSTARWGAGSLVGNFCVALFWLLGAWGVGSAAVYAAAGCFVDQTHRGMSAMMAATGLAILPWGFVGPVGAIAPVAPWLASIARVLIFLWWLLVLVSAVRGATGLTGGRSALAIALAAVAFLILPLAILGMLAATLAIAVA